MSAKRSLCAIGNTAGKQTAQVVKDTADEGGRANDEDKDAEHAAANTHIISMRK